MPIFKERHESGKSGFSSTLWLSEAAIFSVFLDRRTPVLFLTSLTCPNNYIYSTNLWFAVTLCASHLCQVFNIFLKNFSHFKGMLTRVLFSIISLECYRSQRGLSSAWSCGYKGKDFCSISKVLTKQEITYQIPRLVVNPDRLNWNLWKITAVQQATVGCGSIKKACELFLRDAVGAH